jgi:hypothetical protein
MQEQRRINMKADESITVKRTGYEMDSVVKGKLWNGRTAYNVMKGCFNIISDEPESEIFKALKEQEGKGHFQEIMGALVDIYVHYEKGAWDFVDTITLGDVSDDEWDLMDDIMMDTEFTDMKASYGDKI